jgi:hypothetical protein
MNNEFSVELKINWKKIISYSITFFAGILIASAIIFYFASKNDSVNELKYKELEQKYELINKKYEEDTKKLIDSNSGLTIKINEAQEINDNIGNTLVNMGNNIADLRNTLLNIRNLYLKQKEILDK